MMLSFRGNNELLVEHPTGAALQEIKDRVVNIWQPGVDFEPLLRSPGTWRFRLKESPWDMSGPHANL